LKSATPAGLSLHKSSIDVSSDDESATKRPESQRQHTLRVTMADLFHLLDELNAPQDEAVEPEIAIRPDDDDEQPPVDQEEEDVDRQILSLPPVLIQAARAAHQEADEERLDLQDFVHHTSRDERQEYALLQHWWVQELQAPEILPWRADVMRPMMEAAFSDADESAVQERSTLQAILADVRQVDRERVQFVAAHLLQTRLQKIQEKPWFYSKEENNERMSLQEVSHLFRIHRIALLV
jgi:hypothetical protein